ncbi:MAG: hypothetical protein JWN34_4223, partial [Bryobacterales bacterium]|nr:hypothetical protein [Bryobacterales bacterium]
IEQVGQKQQQSRPELSRNHASDYDGKRKQQQEPRFGEMHYA